jgi:hypothetical protein
LRRIRLRGVDGRRAERRRAASGEAKINDGMRDGKNGDDRKNPYEARDVTPQHHGEGDEAEQK